jgi:energy-coupling factor transporter ATP-binding protein EcfA2
MDDLIQRIYRAFGTGPLTPEQFDLYVDLDPVRGEQQVAQRLAEKIRLTGSPTHQVLAGHRGSGKSTELYRLQRELEHPSGSDKRYFVVFCKTDEDLDRNDVDFFDVLVTVVRQMATQLKDRAGISLKPGYFKDRFERMKTALAGEVTLDSLGIDVGLFKIATTIKSSPNARREIRKLFEPDAGNWLHAANDVIGQAVLGLRDKGYAGLVVIVDDLDKMVSRPDDAAGCLTTEYLFVHRAGQLTEFECHMVYDMPISLAFSHYEQRIKTNFGGHVPVVSMTKVMTPPPRCKPYKPGIEKFREVIAKRLTSAGAAESDLFADQRVRDELIYLSGGQPTELMTLVREAVVTKGLPVTSDSLRRAQTEGRKEYARQLREEHLPLLAEAAKTGWVKHAAANENAFRELLEMRALLQYENDKEWYGVNPQIGDLLPSKRPARKR